MTDHDIVDELRGFAGDTQSARASLMRDAADKIEELRADLERWEQVWVHVGKPGMFEVPKPLAVELEVGRLKAVDRENRDEIERLQGEWEYGTALPEAIQEDGMGYANEKAALAHAARCGECVLVRRRKAGPWEPVTGDGDAHGA